MSDTTIIDGIEQSDPWALLNATEQQCDDLHTQLAEANATIATMREELREVLVSEHRDAYGQLHRVCSRCRTRAYNGEAHVAPCPLITHTLPPAAAKLLAERDAGRALYEAVRPYINWTDDVLGAVEAYQKVVDANTA